MAETLCHGIVTARRLTMRGALGVFVAESMSEPTPTAAPSGFAIQKKRLRLLGLTVDDTIKAFFGGNAIVAIVVLTLITFFLMREGLGFFAQNNQSLQVYRQAGLEYVDFIRAQVDDHTALTRYLSDLRLRQLTALTEGRKLSLGEANAALAKFDEFSDTFSGTVDPVRSLLSDLT